MVRVTRVLFFLVLIAVPASAQRLPGNVVPEHYTLWFAPDLEKETFRGRESIDVVLTEPSTTVTLHAAEINFSEVTITSGGKTQTARVTLDAARETATFTVPQPIAEGKATIQITYTGILNDKLRGFYISKANGRKYAVSQLEATDARRAFPSFDEPAFKATFDISMMIDAGDTAISNGKMLSDTAGPEPECVVLGNDVAWKPLRAGRDRYQDDKKKESCNSAHHFKVTEPPTVGRTV
jgi:aminopeptidase N